MKLSDANFFDLFKHFGFGFFILMAYQPLQII